MKTASFLAMFGVVVLAACVPALAAPKKAVVDPAALTRMAAVTNGIVPMADATNVPTLWFPVGESMIYNVYWGVIHVGTSRVTTEWVEKDGKPLIRIRHVTRTNKAVASVYPVEDTMESVIEPTTFLPLYFRKNVSEGGYRAAEMTVFDHAKGEAEWGSFKNNRHNTFPIEKDTRDLVTYMYWLRQTQFKQGLAITNRVMTDEKIYDLTLRCKVVDGIELDRYGKVNSARLIPTSSFNGLFVHKGTMTVWVSVDKRCVCTRIEAEVPVASIHIELDQVKGPGDDFWVKKKKD